MAEQRDLPGWPSKRLVREVRSVLNLYVRSRPQQLDECWRMAWQWAAAEADHSLLYQFGKRRRKRWPLPHEIASRYLVLCMVRMRPSLGSRAVEFMPDSVRAMVASESRIGGPAAVEPPRLFDLSEQTGS